MQFVHVSLEAIDANQAQLTNDSGNGLAMGVAEVEIEIEMLLLRRQGHDPEHLVIKLFDDKGRAREVDCTSILLSAEIDAE
jgi:hypothetical protein